ncbi:MAG: prepilin-type N-terminal cleavage/methylation domain-containing protein, partial [Chloroflexi bacterium]|nr:prepilin-type N-terminal cleavage/methylation domain-containing protein [Chloroflexota bacterium]
MRKRFQALRREKGFTLVELLVTTTIIGVLATIVTVNVTGASTSSQNKANITLVGQV